MQVWKEYQQERLNKDVYPLLVNFLEDKSFATAIDIGCGSGNETVYMVKKGIKVLAIDRELDENNILSRLNEDEKKNVSFLHSSFEELDLPKADLIIAFFSLPFCDAKEFDNLWKKIYNALNKDGYLVCQLFGDRDYRHSSKIVNTLSKTEIGKYLSIYSSLKIEEIESVKDDNAWHYYNIIVQKK